MITELQNKAREAESGKRETSFHRTIRSFVLRGGRMTAGQERALENHWQTYGLSIDHGNLEPAAFSSAQFQHLTLEIGFGMGRSLAEMAQKDKQRQFVGVEVHKPGVGALLMEIEKRELENVRIYHDDAVQVLERCIPNDSLDRVQLFFPDPWHKKKHNKRRIVQPGFIELIKKKLMTGGVFHAATDWQPYAEHMLAVLDAAEGLRNCSVQGGFCARPAYRLTTKFERRGVKLGHGVWDILYQKV